MKMETGNAIASQHGENGSPRKQTKATVWPGSYSWVTRPFKERAMLPPGRHSRRNAKKCTVQLSHLSLLQRAGTRMQFEEWILQSLRHRNYWKPLESDSRFPRQPQDSLECRRFPLIPLHFLKTFQKNLHIQCLFSGSLFEHNYNFSPFDSPRVVRYRLSECVIEDKCFLIPSEIRVSADIKS